MTQDLGKSIARCEMKPAKTQRHPGLLPEIIQVWQQHLSEANGQATDSDAKHSSPVNFEKHSRMHRRRRKRLDIARTDGGSK